MDITFINIILSLCKIFIFTFPKTTEQVFRLTFSFIVYINHNVDKPTKIAKVGFVTIVPNIYTSCVTFSKNAQLLNIRVIQNLHFNYWH